MLFPVTDGELVVWAQQELQQKCNEGKSGLLPMLRGLAWVVLGALTTLLG